MHKQTEEIYIINPPTRAHSPKMPLGLMYLASYLDSKKIRNKLLDFKTKTAELARKKIIEELKAKKPKIIGTSCLCTEMVYIKELCRQFKQILPDSTIIVGGAHPSNYPELFVKEEYIDYVVMGEGEVTFYKLCKLLMHNQKPQKKDLMSIPGIAWKGYTSKTLPFANLDELPLPAYDKIDIRHYAKPNSWEIRPVFASVASISTSRGCPFRCRYCVSAAVFGKKVRSRNPKLVVDEIELLIKKYHFDAIYFLDESFTLDREKVINLCKEIKKRKLRFIWGCQTRVNLVTEEILNIMKNAGCIQIDFGVESCSQKLLDIIQKDITVNAIKKAIRLCKKTGIRSFLNLMTNLPEETDEDLQITLDVMKKEKPNVMIWNVTIPYPGTNLNNVIVEDEDLETLNNFPSKNAYELLERKYKLASYKSRLSDVVYNRLYRTFFHPRMIYFNLSPSYVGSFFRFISFIFDPKYLSMLLRTKRKKEYLKEIFRIKTSK